MAASDYTALTPVLSDAQPESELQCFVCETCNVQYAPSAAPPSGNCVVCADERQYVPQGGQRWTTLAKLCGGHRNAFQRMEPQLLGIGTEPKSGIGQRALLVSTPEGNLLWDCIALLDAATRDIVAALGGIKAIAISHPHYYSTCVEWSRAFNAPIYIHMKERCALGKANSIRGHGHSGPLPGPPPACLSLRTPPQCGAAFSCLPLGLWPIPAPPQLSDSCLGMVQVVGGGRAPGRCGGALPLLGGGPAAALWGPLPLAPVSRAAFAHCLVVSAQGLLLGGVIWQIPLHLPIYVLAGTDF